MKIDRRITNGLAWAGVFLVVGVPTADLLSAQFSGGATPGQVALVTAPVPAPLGDRPAAPATVVAVTTPAAQPAANKPVTQAANQTAGVVDNFLQSGKALPSYITGAPASQAPVKAAPAQTAATQPARTPIVTTPASAPASAVDPLQVAAIPPQKIAPVPMPLSMRPRPVTVPVATTAPADIVLPPGLTPQVPPAATVTSADLDDWETGPLADFLARRQGGSSATVTSDYDSNGFFLDQGPNNRDRVVGWDDPTLFSN